LLLNNENLISITKVPQNPLYKKNILLYNTQRDIVKR